MTPEELIAWRKSLGINQGQAADRLRVSRQTIINWERRHHTIPDDLYLKLGTAHDVTKVEDENTGAIWQIDYAELFDRVPGSLTQFVRNKFHPHSLARRGLLGWPGCTWRNASVLQGYTEPHRTILRTEHYAAALEDLEAGVEYHPAVAAQYGIERGKYHPAVAARF